MPETQLIFIYVPCRDAAQAEHIARKVVEQKLAACANIFPSMKSIYWWEGEVRSDNEAVLILKTANHNFKEVESAVKALHSYDVPCIAALNVCDINQAYYNWLMASQA